MTSRQLEVYLDGDRCGLLTQSSTGNLTFDYDEEYRVADSATPLSLSMPLTAQTHRKRVVLPYLQGLLPDSDVALQALARRFNVSVNNPFALLEYVGVDVAGAVQIVPPGAPVPDRSSERFAVRPVSIDEVEVMLSDVVSEYRDGVPNQDAVGRFSLAGAQPKIALHRLPDGCWAVPDGATPTTHILKPMAGGFRRFDVVEHVTMAAAAHLGNQVAQSELVRIGRWHVFISERYDRVVADGQWRRIHQEDLCQALGVSPAKKYQHRDGGPGLADIAALIHSLPVASDREVVGGKFFRAFVFNVIAGCTDAHAKNYSLILDGASVRLAPLYDLASYAAYWDRKARLDSAMNVSGEYSLAKISASRLASVGPRFGVVPEAAFEIVRDVSEGVFSAFEIACASLELEDRQSCEVAADLLRGVSVLPLARQSL